MVNLTHRNRFIETRAARFNSAAVPLSGGEGLRQRKEPSPLERISASSFDRRFIGESCVSIYESVAVGEMHSTVVPLPKWATYTSH